MHSLTLPEANIFAPEDWWLKDDPFLLWRPIFSGCVSFRESTNSKFSVIQMIPMIPWTSPEGHAFVVLGGWDLWQWRTGYHAMFLDIFPFGRPVLGLIAAGSKFQSTVSPSVGWNVAEKCEDTLDRQKVSHCNESHILVLWRFAMIYIVFSYIPIGAEFSPSNQQRHLPNLAGEKLRSRLGRSWTI